MTFCSSIELGVREESLTPYSFMIHSEGYQNKYSVQAADRLLMGLKSDTNSFAQIKDTIKQEDLWWHRQTLVIFMQLLFKKIT